MKTLTKILATIFIVAGIIAPARAQLGPSTPGPMYAPNWYQGYVPTPYQWTLMWSNKVDYVAGGIPIKYGGCGATTVAGCLANLGITGAAGSIVPGATTITGAGAHGNGLLWNTGGVLGNLASANSGVLVTSAGGVPSISSTLPSGLAMGTPASINLANGTSLPAAALTGTTLPSGIVTSSLTTVGTLTGGATGAGFTVALGTSTVTGALPAANMPALTGDVTSSAGAVATTLASVATAGTTGSSTAIPVITIDVKGRTTSITTAAVVAPAGTLTGATLAANVLGTSITSTGTLTGGATGAGFTVALGSSTITGRLAYANFVQGATNTVPANVTSGTANFAAFSMPSCSAASSALTWTTNTGFGCNSIVPGTGTVTSVSVVTANGISGTVATDTSTPAITLALGAITPSSVNKVAITAPATSATLTIIDGTIVTGPPASGTMATLAGTETLTNKTLTAAALGSSTATTQSASDNSTKVATTAYVDRLINQSSTGPTICEILTTGATTCNDGSAPANNGLFTTPAGAKWLEISGVGSGGAGSGSGGSNGAGADGVNSTWSAHGGAAILTAAKGLGGTTGQVGGLGGVCTGSIAFSSIAGGQGGYGSDLSAFTTGGFGGGSMFGGGGPSGTKGATAGQTPPANSGGGGGGGGGSAAAGGGGGGGGGGGCYAIISNPAASYDYAVGTSATAGTAGTGGTAGGASGSGRWLVKIHYNY